MGEKIDHDIEDEEHREGFKEFLWSWGPAILALVVIRLFLFEPFRIPSGSMVPTLLIGDQVVVEKLSYGLWLPFKSLGVPFTPIGLDDFGLPVKNVEVFDWGDPDRGDVIVFHFPEDEDKTYIKRIVGLPGDKVKVVENQVYLDGEPQAREYIGAFQDVGQGCVTREARLWGETLPRRDGSDLTHGMLTLMRGQGALANRSEIVVPEDSVLVMGDNRDHSDDGRRWGFVRYDQIKGKARFVWLSWNGCGQGVGGMRTDRMFMGLYGNDGLQTNAP